MTAGTIDNEFLSALCSVQSKILSQMHFTVGGSKNKSLHFQPLPRCYCEDSVSPASACSKWFDSCGTNINLTLWTLLLHSKMSEQFFIRGIKKETSRRPRKRNQYLYVRSIGPDCWGTCPTATQAGNWLYRKIPGAALWTSSARNAWRRRPR